MIVSKQSILFVTLDSCRYDTFLEAEAPALKAVSPLYEAQAPSHYTYGSHAAMFTGFTPGVAACRVPFLNPKYARLFRLGRAGHPGHANPGFVIEGRDIVHGFSNAGYCTAGTAAMGWFDPQTSVSSTLIDGFERFKYAPHIGVNRQVAWVGDLLARPDGRDLFLFINVGETHVPYHFEGAVWEPKDNPCLPFQTTDRRETCRERQRLCCEYVDRTLAPLVARFMHATILVCADHGDCWGENGFWEHGISHPMTLTVPLLIRYKGEPVVAG